MALIARISPHDSLPYNSRLKMLNDEYSVKAGEMWDPKLKISSQAVQKWIPDSITVNGKPSAVGILDTINSCV